MKRVLVVCLGNICRSPLGESILRDFAGAAGLELEVDSAGTGSWHVGDPPDARAIVAGREHGFELADLRARKISAVDLAEFDHVLVADRDTLAKVMRLDRGATKAKVDMLTEYASDPAVVNQDVPDPYYSGRFDPVIALLKDCMSGFVSQLKAEQDR